MNSNSINIFDSLSDLTYEKNNVDYVTNAIFDYNESNPKSEIYKVHLSSYGAKQKVFAMKHQISVHFQDKIYPVSIIIYLTNSFPNTPPEVYLDLSVSNVGVNPKFLKSGEINDNSYQIRIII